MIKDRQNVSRTYNVITIHHMDHQLCAIDFLACLRRGIRAGFSDFKIHCECSTVFPNACVPIAGIIDFYRGNGYTFHFTYLENNSARFENCNIESPWSVVSNDNRLLAHPFDRLFKYNEEQVSVISNAFIEYISQTTICERGVIDALVWCIYEIMDNVFIHANVDYGFVMAQYHAKSNNVVFCIYDNGIGMLNSLLNSRQHTPQSASDAIMLSIQEGIGDGKGAGNGLFGLYQIVTQSNGRLAITTGNSSMLFTPEGVKETSKLQFLDRAYQATTVDFQLNLDKPIDLSKILQKMGGLDVFDIRIDTMTQINDLLQYDISKNIEGTATRASGKKARIDVLNLLKRTDKGIVLDFSRIPAVSSSFLDEFIAKTIVELGAVEFIQLFRIVGMQPTIRMLCNRAIYMRIHDAEDAENQSDELMQID